MSSNVISVSPIPEPVGCKPKALYIASLYIIMGLMFLVDSLAGFLFSPRARIAQMSVLLFLSLTGLIMSHMSATRGGTRNSSKIISIFACMMTGALLYIFGIICLVVGLKMNMNGVEDEDSIWYRQMYGDITFLYIALAAYVSKFLLSFVSAILLLTLTKRREIRSCPQVFLPSKLMIAIPIIFLSLTATMLVFVNHVSHHCRGL